MEEGDTKMTAKIVCDGGTADRAKLNRVLTELGFLIVHEGRTGVTVKAGKTVFANVFGTEIEFAEYANGPPRPHFVTPPKVPAALENLVTTVYTPTPPDFHQDESDE